MSLQNAKYLKFDRTSQKLLFAKIKYNQSFLKQGMAGKKKACGWDENIRDKVIGIEKIYFYIHKNKNPLSTYHHPSRTPCSSYLQSGDR